MFTIPEEEINVEESYCKMCSLGKDEDVTLMCDECNACYHMYCLTPEVTKLPSDGTDWFCPDCKERPVFGTTWIPLGDTPVRHGVLAVLPGTMQLPQYNLTPKVENAQISASYQKHGKNLMWHSGRVLYQSIERCLILFLGSFEAGDVVFFDSHLVHCTSTNEYSSFRLSLDYRWCLSPVGRKNHGKTYLSKFVEGLTADYSL